MVLKTCLISRAGQQHGPITEDGFASWDIESCAETFTAMDCTRLARAPGGAASATSAWVRRYDAGQLGRLDQRDAGAGRDDDLRLGLAGEVGAAGLGGVGEQRGDALAHGLLSIGSGRLEWPTISSERLPNVLVRQKSIWYANRQC